jgi:diadenosine tetraphosphate (Ap4A) HIT family hydrolase
MSASEQMPLPSGMGTLLVEGCRGCEVLLAAERPVPRHRAVVSNDYWHVSTHASSLPGWLIVSLKRHVLRLSDLTADEASALGPLLWAADVALASVLGSEKTYAMLFCEGMPHLHFNVVPRMSDIPDRYRGPRVFSYDGRGSEPLGEAARDILAERLARAWPK